MDAKLEKSLTRDLKKTAKALGLPAGSAEVFIARALPEIKEFLKNKSLITESDLNRAIYKSLKKYNADFAYVYKIRDIII